MKYKIEGVAEGCEEMHVRLDDKFFRTLEEKESRDKLLEAAQHPEMGILMGILIGVKNMKECVLKEFNK